MTKQRPLLPLFLTVFIDLLGFGIAIPTLAVVLLKPEVGVVPLETPFHIRTMLYGLLVAAYPAAQFFGSPILGAISDHRGRKPVLFLAFAGSCIGYALFAIGLHYEHLVLLFASRLFSGFMGGNISTAMSSIADISGNNDKAKAKNFGIIGVAFGLGLILGPYVGGKLSDSAVYASFSFATPFWFAAALCAINTVLFVVLFPETLTRPLQTRISLLTGFRNIGRAFHMKSLRTMFTVMLLFTIGFTFFTQFFQIFLIQKFSFTQSQIGDLFAYIGLWIVVAQGILVRILARFFSVTSVLAWSLALLGLGFLLLLLPLSTWMLLVVLPALAMFQGTAQPNATAIISDLSDEQSQGEILGINQSIQCLAMSVPPVIAGVISGVNQDFPMLAASIITLLAWVVFVFFYRPTPRKFQEIA